MTNIVLIHDGPLNLLLPCTSLIHGLRKKYKDARIYYAVNSNLQPFFSQLKYGDVVPIPLIYPMTFTLPKIDVCISLGDTLESYIFTQEIKSDVYLGHYDNEHFPYYFQFEVTGSENKKEANEAIKSIRGIKASEKNIFQLFYKMAQMRWEGEGYLLPYSPKTDCDESRVGVAIKDEVIRPYVKRTLFNDNFLVWHVPIRNKINKQIDEINKCGTIVTDDETVMHLSLALRKKVEFLSSTTPTYKIEMFGKGNVHNIENINKETIMREPKNGTV